MLELFRQCGILLFVSVSIIFIGYWSCSDSVVCYCLSLFLLFLIGCWSCSDSVVFYCLSLFYYFWLDAGAVPTVWYFTVCLCSIRQTVKYHTVGTAPTSNQK
jgi:hypothetical protein